MNKLITTFTATALALTGIAAAPAAAHDFRVATAMPAWAQADADGSAVEHRRRRGWDRGYERGYGRGYERGYYEDRGRYDDRRDYRGYRCDNGTGGLVIGGVAGALAGREIAGRRGDRTAGAIIGGAVGALAGRAIDRSDRRC